MKGLRRGMGLVPFFTVGAPWGVDVPGQLDFSDADHSGLCAVLAF